MTELDKSYFEDDTPKRSEKNRGGPVSRRAVLKSFGAVAGVATGAGVVFNLLKGGGSTSPEADKVKAPELTKEQVAAAYKDGYIPKPSENPTLLLIVAEPKSTPANNNSDLPVSKQLLISRDYGEHYTPRGVVSDAEWGPAVPKTGADNNSADVLLAVVTNAKLVGPDPDFDPSKMLGHKPVVYDSLVRVCEVMSTTGELKVLGQTKWNEAGFSSQLAGLTESEADRTKLIQFNINDSGTVDVHLYKDKMSGDSFVLAESAHIDNIKP